MSHLESYNLIEAGSKDELTIAVNHSIAYGWELHGPTQVISNVGKNAYGGEHTDTSFFQAMVRFKQEGEGD